MEQPHYLRHVFLSKMAATLCVKLLPKPGWLPLTQSVRHGSKAVTRHRKPLHILKQKLVAVTKYIPPARVVPPGAYPSQTKQVQEDSALMLLMKRELEKLFQDCKMVAVVQNNASNAADMMSLKHRLYKHGVTIKFFPNQVVRSFLKDSIYCNMAPLFIGPTVLFVSKEPKVKEMLTSLRSSPQMTLLGACVDNTLLSAEGLVNYSKLPSVTVVQGQLVSGLAMLTSHTASMLQRHPAHLSALLRQHVKQQSPAPEAEEAT
ncbi:39S ribosomal protein L10, mitochondrial [Xiphias gladius]|uniref:39S ribosomal protein L10, mitochondrial n=1 Tax=Xiphias gladius TaxID=8245 RepID=UPI001A99B9F2|nr:39S ribosomal protein L10, mitochondrial [Xiphias gladius]XP_039992218.1 39S ribosomal protein L10, mitochondrial [Xiphias gladius]XP_039992219.1 39S ribosomal protein L10, mitochondrial [Xiphias gladius]